MAILGTGLTSLLLGSIWPCDCVFYIFYFVFFSDSTSYYLQSLSVLCGGSILSYTVQRIIFLQRSGDIIHEPIAWWEKIGTAVGFTFLGAYPLFVELYGVYVFWMNHPENVPLFGVIGVFIGTLLTLILFYVVFFLLYCPHCVNFSCVFNKVPDEYVQRYLASKSRDTTSMGETEEKKLIKLLLWVSTYF